MTSALQNTEYSYNSKQQVASSDKVTSRQLLGCIIPQAVNTV